MSQAPPSSKTAAIAGTLAGLLAAGLGAYYLQLREPAMPATAPAPVAAAATTLAAPPAAPTAAASNEATEAAASADAPAPPPSAVAPISRNKEQATLALLALPELKAWSQHITQNSGGKAHGALVEYDPTPRVVKGRSYWQLNFVENSAEAAQPWESFLVSTSSDEILVEDLATDQLISLERWRREKHPLQRVSSGG